MEKPFTIDRHFAGLHVYLTGFYDCGDWRTSCHVQKGAYSSSLEHLDGEGFMYHDNGYNELKINQSTIDEISDWANDHGY